MRTAELQGLRLESCLLYTSHQISTIIAALRMYQFELAINTLGEWLDIATDGGTIVPLDDDEIDALCERLNACLLYTSRCV